MSGCDNPNEAAYAEIGATSVVSPFGAPALPAGIGLNVNAPLVSGRTGLVEVPVSVRIETPRRAGPSNVTGNPVRKLVIPENPQPPMSLFTTGLAVFFPNGSS